MRLIIVISSLLALMFSGAVRSSCLSGVERTKPNDIYIDHLDGTVTDKTTGLTWAKCSVGQTWVKNDPDDYLDDRCTGNAVTHTWQEASAAALSANSNSYLGVGGWRVPNIKELESLWENACARPSINSDIFPDTPVFIPAWYWSSTPRPGFGWSGMDSDAWNMESDGTIYQKTKSEKGNVRLVRD